MLSGHDRCRLTGITGAERIFKNEARRRCDSRSDSLFHHRPSDFVDAEADDYDEATYEKNMPK